jgi:hypothetical protein
VIRGDLSSRLIHLTRGDTARQAIASFLSIVRGGRLNGGTGHVRGGYRCVCFSEAPIAVIAQMVANQDSRYAPLGVMVDKTWLFAQGGRPVIYQPESEFDALPEDIRYRHVRYDPVSGVDVTWEREWRIRTDSLELDPRATTFVVPSRAIIESLVDEHVDLQRYEVAALGDAAAEALSAYPWHFLSLDDLGLEIDFG